MKQANRFPIIAVASEARAACALLVSLVASCAAGAPPSVPEDAPRMESPADAGASSGGLPTTGAHGDAPAAGSGPGRSDAAATATSGSPTDAAAPSDAEAAPPDAVAPPADAASDGAPEPGLDGGSVSRRSPGCGKGQPGSGAWAGGTITIRRTERAYRLFIPKTYDATRAYPLVFVLHGAGGSGAGGDIAAFAQTSREDALLVAPSGARGRWDLARTGPDFELLDALRARVEASHCVDRGRVFSYGFSMGGAMSTVYACGRPGVLRAFASQQGGLPDGVPSCVPTAAWLSNAPNDQVVRPSWYQPVHDALAKLNGCAATSKPTPTPTCVKRDGCRPGHELVQCTRPGGHSPEVSFAQPAAWRFFMSLE
jgi:polyhydroxybutyrate depolymerase